MFTLLISLAVSKAIAGPTYMVGAFPSLKTGLFGFQPAVQQSVCGELFVGTEFSFKAEAGGIEGIYSNTRNYRVDGDVFFYFYIIGEAGFPIMFTNAFAIGPYFHYERLFGNVNEVKIVGGRIEAKYFNKENAFPYVFGTGISGVMVENSDEGSADLLLYSKLPIAKLISLTIELGFLRTLIGIEMPLGVVRTRNDITSQKI